MPCIHGLDENSCPNCRLMKSSLPESQLNIKNVYNHDLKPLSSKMAKNEREKKDFLFKLLPNSKIKELIPVNATPERLSLTDLPQFENNLFSRRLRELDLSKIDKHGISTNIKLTSPEWDFAKKE